MPEIGSGRCHQLAQKDLGDVFIWGLQISTTWDTYLSHWISPLSLSQDWQGMKTINSNKRRSTDKCLLKAPNEETILAAVPVKCLLCIYWQESLGIYNKGKGQVIRRKGRAGFSLLQPVSLKWSLAVLTGVSFVSSLRAPILCAPKNC